MSSMNVSSVSRGQDLLQKTMKSNLFEPATLRSLQMLA
jgi:hypothetical protein